MESSTGSALARFLGKGLRQRFPNSVYRTVDGRELIRQRREAREKRVFFFLFLNKTNEYVHLQCLKLKKWDTHGFIKHVVVNEEGQICLYDVH